jgi:hypothetical protein
VADVLVAPYNDLAASTAIVNSHCDTLAAIIVEPLHRCTSPGPGFLAGLRELATERGRAPDLRRDGHRVPTRLRRRRGALRRRA